MGLLPDEVSVPSLPYAKELTEEFNALKSNPSMAEKLEGIDIPDLSAMETIQINMNSNSGNFEMPQDIIEKLQASDVTTITDTTKMMAEYMFSKMSPTLIANITSGIDSGITAINESVAELEEAVAAMPPVPTMKDTIDQMNQGKAEMVETVEKMTVLKEAVPEAFDTAKTNYLSEIENSRDVIENEFQTVLNTGYKQVYATVAIASLLAMIVLMFYREEKKSKLK